MATIKDGKVQDFTTLVDNPNAHTKRGHASIENSMREDGYTAPMTATSDGVVLDGNKRLEISADIMPEDAIIVHHDGKRPIIMVRDDIKSSDEIAYRIALRANRTAQLDLEWDPAVIFKYAQTHPEVVEELWNETELTQVLMGIGESGFGGNEEDDDDEEKEDESDQPDVEAAQSEFSVKDGDVWEINGDYFICGDSTQKEVYDRLIDCSGIKMVNGVFTSPPYAMQRKNDYGGVPEEDYVEWFNDIQENVKDVLAKDGSFFVNIKPHCEEGERVLYVFDLVLAMRRKWNWKFVDELCWRRVTVPGKWNNRFKNYFEPIYHFAHDANKIKFFPHNVAYVGDKARKSEGGSAMIAHGGKKKRAKADDFYYGDILPSNVLEITNTVQNQHSASFAIELAEFFVNAYSEKGDTWLDPFSGSASLVIGARKNGRRGLGIERDPKYLAYGLFRYRQKIGGEANRVYEQRNRENE
mgnify:CR=1 FL=1